MKLQFRMRTLMIVVTLLAVPLGYVGWQAKIVRERKGIIQRIVQNGGKVFPLFTGEDDAPPLVRRLLGDELIGEICVRGLISPDEQRLIKAAFPEAGIREWAALESTVSPPP